MPKPRTYETIKFPVSGSLAIPGNGVPVKVHGWTDKVIQIQGSGYQMAFKLQHRILGPDGVSPIWEDITAAAALTEANIGEVIALPLMADEIRMVIATVTQFAALAATVTSGNPETYNLTDGWTLITAGIDGGGIQTATFNTADFSNITIATALEVAAVLNTDWTGVLADGSSGSVVITSLTTGASSDIGALTGTAAAALGFSTGASGSDEATFAVPIIGLDHYAH